MITALLALTLITSLVGPFFLHTISVEAFKPILAILTFVSLPFLFLKPKAAQASRRRTGIGMLGLGALLLASSFITSSAFSILIAIVLTRSLGLTILQGTAMRRLMGLIQSAIIFVILATLGNFLWLHAVFALIGGTIGSYLGTRYAIKRGEMFAKYALAVGAVVGTVAMLLI